MLKEQLAGEEQSSLKRILLVDDDQGFSLITQRMLEKLNFDGDLLSFENGQELYRLIELQQHDGNLLANVIFLDLNVSIVDGWQFLDAYQEIQDQMASKIRIYILSSSNFSEDIRKAEEYPMVLEYLVKPLSSERLMEIIKAE